MKNDINICPEVPGNISIIIRHAERHPIEFMSHALEARLTEQGQSDAYELGRLMSRFSPVKLFHSPVPRCAQTAESILNGIVSVNQKAEIAGFMLELGGPYITGNWEEIVKNVERYGHSLFIRKWFNNELPPAMIMPLPEAARSQLNILVNQLRSGGASTINITHDWNIMIFREYFFNLRHEDIGDPDYLDGLCAYQDDSSLHLRYHDYEKIIPLAHITV